MRNIKNAPSKRIRPTAGIFILVAMLTGAAAASLAQEQSYLPKKPVTTEISSRLFVLADAAVEEQWKASLDLVNAPGDQTQIEPGQCIRFAVVATGDDRGRLLDSEKVGIAL